MSCSFRVELLHERQRFERGREGGRERRETASLITYGENAETGSAMPLLPEDILTRYWAGFSHPRLASEAVSKWKKNRKVLQNNGSGNFPSKGAEMSGGLKDIIARLEVQKSAIEQALSALKEIEDTGVRRW
jgi:hypothetical protein